MLGTASILYVCCSASRSAILNCGGGVGTVCAGVWQRLLGLFLSQIWIQSGASGTSCIATSTAAHAGAKETSAERSDGPGPGADLPGDLASSHQERVQAV